MIHAVVITHGRLGEELLNSAEMVFGQIKGIDSVALLKEDTPGSFEEKICKVLKKEEEQLLFLADIYGGTPYNAAVSLLKKYNAWIVTGVNLGMVLELVSTIETVETAEKMAKNMLETAAFTCQAVNRENFSAAFRETEEEDL